MNFNQQPTILFRFNTINEPMDRIRMKRNPGDVMNRIRQFFKCHFFFWGESLVALPDQVIDMVPGCLIFSLIGHQPSMNFGIPLFICPLFTSKIFLIFFVLREEMVHHSLPANSIIFSYCFEGLRFSHFPFYMKFSIPITPDSQKFRIICWGLLFPGRASCGYHFINTESTRRILINFSVTLALMH